jgi:glycosyltransferase involved in cell wall biosynthesis
VELHPATLASCVVNVAPRVTVCIPTYDRPRWLGRAIESVLAQGYGDLRLEIHDDATPGPGVRDVVARYDDPRLQLIEHDENVGIVANFSRSLLGAGTEYVLQLGDDDVMHPDLLEATVAALDRHPSAGMAHTRFDLVDGDDEILLANVDWTVDGGRPPLESGDDFLRASMLYGCRVCSSTALLRRSAVPLDGFRQQDFPAFDFVCWLRMAEQWDVAFVPRALCRYRMHPESHSSGVADLRDDAYIQRLQTLQTVHTVKLRHIEASGGSSKLTRLAHKGRARDLLARVRHLTVPERPFVRTALELARGVRIEPALARDIEAWLLLGGSVIKSPAVAWIKQRSPAIRRRRPG